MSRRTYEKRLGRRNVEGTPIKEGYPGEGEVHDWYTKDGVAVCFPDDMEGEEVSGVKLEPIPEGVETVNMTSEEQEDATELHEQAQRMGGDVTTTLRHEIVIGYLPQHAFDSGDSLATVIAAVSKRYEAHVGDKPSLMVISIPPGEEMEASVRVQQALAGGVNESSV